MTDGAVPLPGGVITGAERIGDTVRRPTGPWTPAVHALLFHLENVGFRGVPRVLGIDERGREILTYLDGGAGSLGYPPALLHEDGASRVGRFIRAYHDAVATFVPTDRALWRIGMRPVDQGEVVCHGDLGHWNTIWRGAELVGLIDWDFAEPGPPLRDVATAAITVVPFVDDDRAGRMGFKGRVDRRRRLEVLCEAYGTTRWDLLAAAADAVALELERLVVFGEAGREPWKSQLEQGKLKASLDRLGLWLEANRDALA